VVPTGTLTGRKPRAAKISALMDFYIHPLKGIFIIIKYTVFPHPSILYIILYLLWGPLVTLSKYIHMTSYFEVFIETNLMVQSKFNLVFLFVNYNIFSSLIK
jgi:hypothetical protein